ncbi:MAG: response regulator [Chloroflexota bacterium]
MTQQERTGAARRVLVVDDDASIRRFIADTLADEGYVVETAPDGEAALKVVAAFRPDVILLDLTMPRLDGWEFAERYRQQPGPHAPIIVLTAARDISARDSRIDASAVLGKPFDLDVLLAVVRRWSGRSPA